MRAKVFGLALRLFGPRFALRVYVLGLKAYHWRAEYLMWRAGLTEAERDGFRAMHREHARDINRFASARLPW